MTLSISVFFKGKVVVVSLLKGFRLVMGFWRGQLFTILFGDDNSCSLAQTVDRDGAAVALVGGKRRRRRLDDGDGSGVPSQVVETLCAVVLRRRPSVRLHSRRRLTAPVEVDVQALWDAVEVPRRTTAVF